MRKYYLAEEYSMKCRLYPNKTDKEILDKAILAVHKAHNIILYDIVSNMTYSREHTTKDKKIIHYVDWYKYVKSENIKQLLPSWILKSTPAGSLTANNGVVLSDLKRSFSVVGEGKTKPRQVSIENSNANYYSKSHPRRSIAMQISKKQISTTSNINVLRLKFGVRGSYKLDLKVRGWNRKIRFDESGKVGFTDWLLINPKSRITIVIAKDRCGDYFVTFKLHNVYLRASDADKDKHVGIDVGIKTLAVCSDGNEYANQRFKEVAKKHLKALNKQMSRRKGFANPDFRKQFKEKQKNGELIAPSKTYEQSRLAYAKLNRKISRQREHYNHNVSKDIIERYGFVGIETLNVSEMMRSKNHSRSLSDVALGQLLSSIKYKGDWYDREIHPIGRYLPSTKRCFDCGYIMKENLSTDIREWTCPNCGKRHDRDLNAAKNIEYYALNKH